MFLHPASGNAHPGLLPGDGARNNAGMPRVSGVFEGTAGIDSRAVSSTPADGDSSGITGGSPKSSGTVGKTADEMMSLDTAVAFERFRDSKVPDLMVSKDKSTRLYEGGGPADGLETPMEQIRRIQGEIADLYDVVSTLVATAQAKTDQPSGLAMKELASFLQAEPHELLEDLLGLRSKIQGVSDTVANLRVFEAPATAPATDATAACSNALRSQFLNQLEELLRSVDASTSATAKTAPRDAAEGSNLEGGPLVFELYPSVDPQPALDKSLILDLERRLAGVEDVLGVTSNSHVYVPFANLSTASKEIAARLSLMHPARLSSLSPDCKRLNQKIDLLQQQLEKHTVLFRASDNLGPSLNESVTRLYEFCEASRSSMAALPAVLRRLNALKWLHQEAAGVGSRLEGIEQQQSELEEMLNTMNSQFEKLREAVQENIQLAMKVVSSKSTTQVVESTG